MQPLSYRLRRAGYKTLAPWYDSWRLSLPAIVDRLSRKVDSFASTAAMSQMPLHFIGHSMGGLVSRALINRNKPATLGRVVMLGTPNHGSELADLLIGWPATRVVLGRAAPTLTTNRGAELDMVLGPIDYPVGVIAGDRPVLRNALNFVMPAPHDGKVSVAATHLTEEVDHLVLPLSHSMLAYHAMAHSQAIHFLSHGEFQRS